MDSVENNKSVAAAVAPSVATTAPAIITQLTPEQVALLPVYRDEGIKIGLKTGPADRKMAEEGVRLAYLAANLTPPTEIRWVDSPLIGWKEALKINPNDAQPCYGQHDIFWLQYYAYMGEVLKLDCVEPLRGLMMIAKSAGWWWAYENVAIVSERAKTLHLDDQGRMHHESEMAVSWPDGWGLYSWHGVVVPDFIILKPESIAVKNIREETNLEIKRVMIERMGPGKYLQESNAVVIDMDATSGPGGAPRSLMRDSEGNQYLCGTDGSTERVYFMSVPNNVNTCREAHEAISGLSEADMVAEC